MLLCCTPLRLYDPVCRGSLARVLGIAETDEIIFSSIFFQTPSNISRLNFKTGEVTAVNVTPPIGNAAGATTYRGQVTLTLSISTLLPPPLQARAPAHAPDTGPDSNSTL